MIRVVFVYSSLGNSPPTVSQSLNKKGCLKLPPGENCILNFTNYMSDNVGINSCSCFSVPAKKKHTACDVEGGQKDP